MFIFLATVSGKSCKNEAKLNKEDKIEVVNMNNNQESIDILHDIYVLVSINGNDIDSLNFPIAPPTLEINITENKINGFSGCNNYFGTIDNITTSTINLGPIAATKKYCNNVDETLFFSTLNKVNKYERKALYLHLFENDNLVLSFKKVD